MAVRGRERLAERRRDRTRRLAALEPVVAWIGWGVRATTSEQTPEESS